MCKRVGGKDLPLTDFVPDKAKASGYASRCKFCDREKVQAYYVANREARIAASQARYAAQPKNVRHCQYCNAEVGSRRRTCDTCAKRLRAKKDAKRDLTRLGATARGYGSEHKKERRRWADRVNAGVVDCARCGERIPAGALWDLGHVDGDKSRYAGPEHRKCNRATAGRRRVTSRQW